LARIVHGWRPDWSRNDAEIEMPMRGELPTRAARNYVRSSPSPVKTGCHSFVTAVANPELLTVIAICIIGILVTLNMALLFPDFGGLIADSNSLP
jgi:hypothetical protein